MSLFIEGLSFIVYRLSCLGLGLLAKEGRFIVYCLSFIVSASGNCWRKRKGLSFMVYGLWCQLTKVSAEEGSLSFIVFRLW